MYQAADVALVVITAGVDAISDKACCKRSCDNRVATTKSSLVNRTNVMFSHGCSTAVVIPQCFKLVSCHTHVWRMKWMTSRTATSGQ